MKIENISIEKITPYEYNAKKHDQQQIDAVAESIRQFGFVQPVVIDKDDVIVIGHCRTLAAKKLGMKEVPCVHVDDLTPEQVAALRLADNKTNESEWDFGLLDTSLECVGNIDMSELGFTNLNLDIEDDMISKFLEEADAEKTEATEFAITFTFDIALKAEFDRYIERYGKEAIRDLIIAEVKEKCDA